MKVFCLAFAFTCLAVSANASTRDDKTDLKQMDGTWLAVEAEMAGQKLPEAVLKTLKLTMKDGQYTVQQVDKGTVTVDEKAKPRSMDIVGTEGPNKGKTILAIYELSGDKLRICYELGGKQRPTEFKTAAGTKQFLVTYKREKN